MGSENNNLKESSLDRRKSKSDIKFLVSLNEEQKRVKQAILENPITIVTGNAGTGKTLCVAQTCLDLLFKKELNKVYITRPTKEMGNSLGFLPGSAAEKINPYLDPFKDNLYQCYDKKQVEEKFIQTNIIEGFAIQFARGKTIRNEQMLIIDEAQNLTVAQVFGLITRVGKGGRVIIIGDVQQVDTNESYTGLHYMYDLSSFLGDKIPHIKLKENHRDDIVADIIDYHYTKFKNKN